MSYLIERAEQLKTTQYLKKDDVWVLFSQILKLMLQFYESNFTVGGSFSVPKLLNPIFIYKAAILVIDICKLIKTYNDSKK